MILKIFQNHFILNLLDKKRRTLQIHTGIQEGSGNLINNSDPTLLSNLFLDYKNIKLRFTQFDSIEDMFIDLMYLTDELYKDRFNVFNLTSFVKKPVDSKI